jgi:hypothetical protein
VFRSFIKAREGKWDNKQTKQKKQNMSVIEASVKTYKIEEKTDSIILKLNSHAKLIITPNAIILEDKNKTTVVNSLFDSEAIQNLVLYSKEQKRKKKSHGFTLMAIKDRWCMAISLLCGNQNYKLASFHKTSVKCWRKADCAVSYEQEGYYRHEYTIEPTESFKESMTELINKIYLSINADK